MISRVRFDDILWESSDAKIHGKELQKFIKHLNWCDNLPVTLSPAILCQEIEKFPEGITYIRNRIVEDERFFPDLHGWTHGPYGNLSQWEIEEHLEKSFEWFERNLAVLPYRWITPHGANSYAIQAAAKKFSLIVEDTKFPVMDQKDADTKIRETRSSHCLDDRVIMVHFWERGLRLYRIARMIQFGNAEDAIAETKKELDEKSHAICWRGW